MCGHGPGYKPAGGAISGLRGSDIFSDMFAAPLVLGKMCHGTSWCKLFVAIQDSIKACKEFEFALLGEKRNKQRPIK